MHVMIGLVYRLLGAAAEPLYGQLSNFNRPLPMCLSICIHYVLAAPPRYEHPGGSMLAALAHINQLGLKLASKWSGKLNKVNATLEATKAKQLSAT